MPIENTRQVVRELIKKTESREIRWWNTIETSDKLVFKYIKKVTDKKNLTFTVTSKREKYQSDLSITFGPVTLQGVMGEKERETLVALLTIRTQPLLYDLIDALNKKHRDGDVKYLNESVLNEFFTNDVEGKERSEKLKNLKLLSMLTKHTEEGKLNWEDTYHDKHVATFICKHALTKLKGLVFSVRSCDESEIKEDNILRVLLKTENKSGNISHNTTVIKSVSLKEYPALVALIQKLNKKYLGRKFESPFLNQKNVNDLDNFTKTIEGKPKTHELLVADDLEDYRKYTLDAIKVMIRSMPNTLDWEDRFADVYDAYEDCKRATSMEELNDLMYKAHTISEKGKKPKSKPKEGPIGTPRWAR